MRNRGLVGVLLVLAAAIAFAWLRPAELLFAVRDLKLRRMGFDERHVRVGAHRIHYLVGGEGPPLVLVHGLAMTAKDWSPLLEELSAGRRLYALDLLGTGDSDRPADVDYSIPQQSEIVHGFLDATSLRQADILGVSMGGWISLHLAAEHPERVRRLVLVSSAGFRFPTEIQEGTFAPRTISELEAMMALQTDRPARMPRFLARDLVRVLRKQEMVVRRATASMLTLRDTMEGRVANVRMPVQIVSGTADRVVPFDVAMRMRDAIPQAELVPLTGCGHFALLECKAAALPAIKNFLDRR